MEFWNFPKETNERDFLVSYFLLPRQCPTCESVEESTKCPESREPVARRASKLWNSLKILKFFSNLAAELGGGNSSCSKGIFSSCLEIKLISRVISQTDRQC